jgi:hypothetical protein
LGANLLHVSSIGFTLNPDPYKEAVKKPIALLAKESARVFLWIALADLGGFVFPLFSACGGF